MKLVCMSFSCFSSFVHETKTVCLSRVSLALFMRLRLLSVVGEFLWSGERPVDDDVQCFPGGH